MSPLDYSPITKAQYGESSTPLKSVDISVYISHVYNRIRFFLTKDIVQNHKEMDEHSVQMLQIFMSKLGEEDSNKTETELLLRSIRPIRYSLKFEFRNLAGKLICSEPRQSANRNNLLNFLYNWKLTN